MHQYLHSVAQTLATDQLYNQMWVYYTLFQPVMHLTEKQIVRRDGQPTRVIRRHDQARTPFDRLCETDAILTEHRVWLETLRDQINPRWLRQHIYDAIDAIFSLPGASPGVAEDVYKTLATHQNLDLGGDFCFDLAFNRTTLVEGGA